MIKEIDKTAKIIKNIQASVMVTEPVANGLPTVRVTNLSILKSLISFITQPHDLTTIDPIITII